ncbi:L-threonylcarbamoyladenylate synthase [Nevskia soli]|uniref:L-threonylcarbamoyladenylate synthase n=1 Tax=Nevskia soli TaxID=418856 RepID=UPI0004A6F56F|nr:L-threonylcarbamoyladenylate synthase [Nevskia soli]
MSAEWLELHPIDPQKRWLQRAADRVRAGDVIAYPTDSCYALGCHLGDKDAAERIRRIRQFDKHHMFTLVCRDLSEIATYARVDNWQYRLLKALTPGPYTFILEGSRELPRRLVHEKRKTIGIRVPEHKVTQALLELLNEPLMSCTLQFPDAEEPVSDPNDYRAELEHQVDLVLDGGPCGLQPTTVIDLTGDAPVLVRQGRGDVSGLGLAEA